MASLISSSASVLSLSFVILSTFQGTGNGESLVYLSG